MLPFELIKDTPYLALSGELWSVFYEYFNRNWSCYRGFVIPIISQICTCYVSSAFMACAKNVTYWIIILPVRATYFFQDLDYELTNCFFKWILDNIHLYLNKTSLNMCRISVIKSNRYWFSQTGLHFGPYFSDLKYKIEDRAPVDFTYWCLVFKWIAVIVL